jgi:hypothetical protein
VINLSDATVRDMVAELERWGLDAAVVTAPRAARNAFADELRARRVPPLPGLLAALPATLVRLRRGRRVRLCPGAPVASADSRPGK